MHVLDLTHWNDAPQRTRGEVVDLLSEAQSTVAAERDRCLDEQLALAAGHTSAYAH